MQKKQGGKSSFTMTGQYASAVMSEDGPMGSREYVMYESPNGEQIKVYGNWNEYAADQEYETGRDLIMDEDYPIIQNEAGEYVLDEVRHNENMDTAYERAPVERMARETAMESTQGASKIENLLEKLQDARGPRRLPGRFENGGKVPGDKVGKMKKSIIRMLEGGATDKEINAAIEKSGLGSAYDFNWDNVQMTVSVKPKDDDRFGPKDEGGQRGDMFKHGGRVGDPKKDSTSTRFERMKPMEHMTPKLTKRAELSDEAKKFLAESKSKSRPARPRRIISQEEADLLRGPFGSHGSSATEDLLERLQDYKRRRR